MALRKLPLTTQRVAVEVDGKRYTGTYVIGNGMITVSTLFHGSQTTHVGDSLRQKDSRGWLSPAGPTARLVCGEKPSLWPCTVRANGIAQSSIRGRKSRRSPDAA
jgi:hypothetical protein